MNWTRFGGDALLAVAGTAMFMYAAFCAARRERQQERMILMLLLVGEQYGLELVKQSCRVLKRSTIYLRLRRLEEKGLVQGRVEPPILGYTGLRRCVFSLTELGKQIARFHARAGLP